MSGGGVEAPPPSPEFLQTRVRPQIQATVHVFTERFGCLTLRAARFTRVLGIIAGAHRDGCELAVARDWGKRDMAVIVTADVPGQTVEGYDRMIAALSPALQEAKGFIAHGAGQAAGGWRVFGIWESQADATEFFAKYIHPNLPEGVKPKRSVMELHSLIMGSLAVPPSVPPMDPTNLGGAG